MTLKIDVVAPVASASTRTAVIVNALRRRTRRVWRRSCKNVMLLAGHAQEGRPGLNPICHHRSMMQPAGLG